MWKDNQIFKCEINQILKYVWATCAFAWKLQFSSLIKTITHYWAQKKYQFEVRQAIKILYKMKYSV